MTAITTNVYSTITQKFRLKIQINSFKRQFNTVCNTLSVSIHLEIDRDPTLDMSVIAVKFKRHGLIIATTHGEKFPISDSTKTASFRWDCNLICLWNDNGVTPVELKINRFAGFICNTKHRTVSNIETAIGFQTPMIPIYQFNSINTIWYPDS